MSYNLKKHCWLVGSGFMAIEYSKVLDNLAIDYSVIGRGKKSAENFQNSTGKIVIQGGLENINLDNLDIPEYAIVAVNVEELYLATKKLIDMGVKKILVEKPGALEVEHLQELINLSEKKQIIIKIAYNRRFYQSVIKLKELTELDGGIRNIHFEFTEWSHKIKNLDKSKIVLNNWLLANSSHVIDLFIHLCGRPKKYNSYVSGSLDWFKYGSIFVGSGITENNVLFSYNSNWEAPGRWSLEISTQKNRFKLAPMEKLSMMKIGELSYKEVEFDYQFDESYKPGIYIMINNFFNGILDDFCDLNEQRKNHVFYSFIRE